MTRRQFLARSGALGAMGLSLPALLAACGGGDSAGGAESTTVSFDNWPLYIDPTEGTSLGTVDRFAEATGITMNYSEGYNDNNEYFAKIQPLLGNGKTIEADIIAPTFWMTGRLISLGWADKLPLAEHSEHGKHYGRFCKSAVGPNGRIQHAVASGYGRHRVQH